MTVFTKTIVCVGLLFVVISVPTQCVAADGQLVVRIVDEKASLTSARAWVEAGGRRYFEPIEPETATPYARDRSFSCDGTFTINVPAGKAVVYVEKGKEYLPVDMEVNIVAGTTVEQTMVVKRWIDMPDRGWYSADLHVHFGYNNPRILRQLALADDVHVLPAFTYWLRGRENSWNVTWPDDSFDKAIVVDTNHLVTRNNIEIERINRTAVPGGTVGATFLFNLDRPVTAARYGEHFPTDAELCRVARQHSPASVFDSDKPSWAETVVGAALDALDTVQVCHNHFHRFNTIAGGWGMIGPMAPGESNAAADDGLFWRTNALYYRFLNCGFRLGVSGGSAIGVMPVPAGYHRVYAHIEGDLTPEKYWAAVKTGRTFATTGPMLTLTASGQEIGSTVRVDSAQAKPVQIKATVQAIENLESLEIVHNARVIASRDLKSATPDPIVDGVIEAELPVKRSGWIVSRALLRAADGLLRQAHTSPIYVLVDDKPIASAEDARYMLRWIERLVQIAESHPERFPDAEAKNRVLTTYAEAKQRYEQIIKDAQRHWND